MYLNRQSLRNSNNNNNNMFVYSVKADALTVDANTIEIVKALFNLDNGRSSLRLSQIEDRSHPTVKLTKTNKNKLHFNLNFQDMILIS